MIKGCLPESLINLNKPDTEMVNHKTSKNPTQKGAASAIKRSK
jgi:hypothetical protein